MRLITTSDPVIDAYGNDVARGSFVWPEFMVRFLYKAGMWSKVSRNESIDHVYRRYSGDDPKGKTVLLFRISSWGDSLWLTPLARHIAERGGRVWIACRTKFHEVYQANKHVSRVFPVPCPIAAFERSDYQLHFEGTLETSLDKTIPAVDLIARHAGIALDNHALVYSVDRHHRNAARRRLNVNNPEGLPTVCVQAAATHQARTYPADQMREVLSALGENSILSVVVGSGAEGKRPSQFCPTWKLPRVLDACGAFKTIGESVALMEACGCLLAPDSAFVHFAGALGVPTVGLYGPYPSSIRTNYYPKCRVVEAVFPCAPCMIQPFHRCPNERDSGWSRCWSTVKPETVVSSVLDMMKDYGLIQDDRE